MKLMFGFVFGGMGVAGELCGYFFALEGSMLVAL